MLSQATSSRPVEEFKAKIAELLANINHYRMECHRIDNIKWEPKTIKRRNGGYVLDNSNSPEMLKMLVSRDIQYKIDVFAHYAERYYDPSKASNEKSIKPKESRSVMYDMGAMLGHMSTDNQSLASLINTALNTAHPTTSEEVLTICHFAHQSPKLLNMVIWLQQNSLATEENFKKLKAYEGDDIEFFPWLFNVFSAQHNKPSLQLMFNKFFRNKVYSQSLKETVIADNFSLSVSSQKSQLYTIKIFDLAKILQIYSSLNDVDKKVVICGNPIREKKSFSSMNQEILASLQKSLQQPLNSAVGHIYEKLYDDETNEKVAVLTSVQLCMVARILYRAMIPDSSSIEFVEQGGSQQGDLAGGKSLEKYNDKINSQAAFVLSQKLFGEQRANALIKFWKFSLVDGDGFSPQTLELFFSMPVKHAYDFVAVLTEMRVNEYGKRDIQYHYPAYSKLMFETLHLMKHYMLAHEPIQTEPNHEDFLNMYGHAQHTQHHKNPLLINMTRAFLFLAKKGLWTQENRDLLFSHKQNANLFVQLSHINTDKIKMQKLIDKLFAINDEIMREDVSFNFAKRKNTSWQFFDNSISKRVQYCDAALEDPNTQILKPKLLSPNQY